MGNGLFSIISDNYYLRRYTLNSQIANKPEVTIFAECAPNVDGVNGHYYFLELYLSVGDIGFRDFLFGVSFGTKAMDKEQLDKEIDSWVGQVASETTFPNQVAMYLKEVRALENLQTDEAGNNHNE